MKQGAGHVTEALSSEKAPQLQRAPGKREHSHSHSPSIFITLLPGASGWEGQPRSGGELAGWLAGWLRARACNTVR